MLNWVSLSDINTAVHYVCITFIFAAFCAGYWLLGAFDSRAYSTAHVDGNILLWSAKSGQDHIKHSACWVPWLSSNTASLHNCAGQPQWKSTVHGEVSEDVGFSLWKDMVGIRVFFLGSGWEALEQKTQQAKVHMIISLLSCRIYTLSPTYILWLFPFLCHYLSLFCPLPFPLPQKTHIPWPNATRGSFTRVDVSWLTAR